MGNWYEEQCQREKDNLRKRFDESNTENPAASVGFRKGKERARYVQTMSGPVPIMNDDPDIAERDGMGNIQSLPDMLKHYETESRVAEAPFQSTVRENNQRMKQFVAATHKPVPKRKMLKEDMLMKEAMRQVLEEQQRQNVPIGSQERFQTTYKATACATGEQTLRVNSALQQNQNDQPQIAYTEEDPVTFYSQAVDSDNGANTSVYHSKTAGRARFGKSLGFSCPVEQYHRGVDKE
eukprot:CAMPEP_0117448114 /NCGR_PEP_ID=MMETSP0759-20121206/7229_1 /TAXON_ID=63605 /ORGANISM="Percolomonas cosmopolitus, Strain WS" /LENGTH=236 /DNA_ID=CAMNT_0005240481 /DNA_START=175 /DNA_END=885 /DNA_ORIENTATION=-